MNLHFRLDCEIPWISLIQSREPSGGAPEGRWGHSGYVEQNNIKGGNLAARMQAKRAPGGVDVDDISYTASNSQSNKRGAAGGGRRAIADSSMLSRAVADATGQNHSPGGSLGERVGLKNSAPSKGRGALSVKGASGTTVEVRNLVKGTSAEDVKVSPYRSSSSFHSSLCYASLQAIFSDKGAILSATESPSSLRDSVTVQVRFASAASAEEARQTFDRQVADGRKIEVVVLGGGLLMNALASGITPQSREKGSDGFDLLPESGGTGGGM